MDVRRRFWRCVERVVEVVLVHRCRMLLYVAMVQGPYRNPHGALVDMLLHMYIVCDNGTSGAQVLQMFSHDGTFIRTIPLESRDPLRCVACRSVLCVCQGFDDRRRRQHKAHGVRNLKAANLRLRSPRRSPCDPGKWTCSSSRIEVTT